MDDQGPEIAKVKSELVKDKPNPEQKDVLNQWAWDFKSKQKQEKEEVKQPEKPDDGFLLEPHDW